MIPQIEIFTKLAIIPATWIGSGAFWVAQGSTLATTTIDGGSGITIDVVIALVGVLVVVFLAFLGAVWKLAAVLSEMGTSIKSIFKAIDEARGERRILFDKVDGIDDRLHDVPCEMHKRRSNAPFPGACKDGGNHG